MSIRYSTSSLQPFKPNALDSPSLINQGGMVSRVLLGKAPAMAVAPLPELSTNTTFNMLSPLEHSGKPETTELIEHKAHYRLAWRTEGMKAPRAVFEK